MSYLKISVSHDTTNYGCIGLILDYWLCSVCTVDIAKTSLWPLWTIDVCHLVTISLLELIVHKKAILVSNYHLSHHWFLHLYAPHSLTFLHWLFYWQSLILKVLYARYICKNAFCLLVMKKKEERYMNQDTNQEEWLCDIISVTVMVVDIMVMVIYLKTALGLITKVTILVLFWFSFYYVWFDSVNVVTTMLFWLLIMP